MSVKIRKLTRNNIWVDQEAILSKESFGDDYEMYVSYCDSRRIVERNNKHYECIILPIPKTLWDILSELVITPHIERARNIHQTLGLEDSIESYDDAYALCHWYDCYYLNTPEEYPKPILGL